MGSTVESVYIVVGGRVQGVGFRYYTKQRAESHGLHGFVRNLPDGNVEVLACGPRNFLEELIKEIEVGPPGSLVKNCQIDWRPTLQPLDGFTINY